LESPAVSPQFQNNFFRTPGGGLGTGLANVSDLERRIGRLESDVSRDVSPANLNNLNSMGIKSIAFDSANHPNSYLTSSSPQNYRMSGSGMGMKNSPQARDGPQAPWNPDYSPQANANYAKQLDYSSSSLNQFQSRVERDTLDQRTKHAETEAERGRQIDLLKSATQQIELLQDKLKHATELKNEILSQQKAELENIRREIASEKENIPFLREEGGRLNFEIEKMQKYLMGLEQQKEAVNRDIERERRDQQKVRL
jgi:hypothetical protein